MYNWAHNEKCECFVYCVLQFWNRRTLPTAQWRAVLMPSANLIPVLKCIWYYNSALQAGIPNGTSCSYVHFVRCIKLYQLGDEGQRGQKKWGAVYGNKKSPRELLWACHVQVLPGLCSLRDFGGECFSVELTTQYLYSGYTWAWLSAC